MSDALKILDSNLEFSLKFNLRQISVAIESMGIQDFMQFPFG